MPVFIDQTGRSIIVSGNPQRIISTVPSQTELLADLGIEDALIALTKFCVHPAHWFRTKKRIGGTKKLDLPLIHSLQPDLIIANKEENEKEEIEALAKDFPVWISDVHTIADAYGMIATVGQMTGKDNQATQLIRDIKNRFIYPLPRTQPRACYLIWQEPYMTVGGDTFIHAMLEQAGFDNIYKSGQRYPVISIHELQTHSPDVLLLSSEPFPFRQQHADQLSALLPATKILLVDGELFSWYGSRMLLAATYFKSLADTVSNP